MLKTPDEIKSALANCNKLRYSPYCEDYCPTRHMTFPACAICMRMRGNISGGLNGNGMR